MSALYRAKDVACIDFETRSGTDIKRGLGQYFADPEADVFMLAHKLPGQDTVAQWDRGVQLDLSPPDPTPLLDHVDNGGLVSGWNVAFEIEAWNRICVPRFKWPVLRPEQCIDTMCVALIHNLPGDLLSASQVLGLGADKEKSKRGKHLIRRLSCKQKPTKTRPGEWVHDAELYAEYLEYNKQDVVAEFAVLSRLRPWTEYQRDVWLFTHRMNQRGLPIDVDACARLDSIYRMEQARLNAELSELTKGAVPKATKRKELLDWANTRLAEDGHFINIDEPTGDDIDPEEDDDEPVTVDSARADYLRDVLAGELPADVRRALEIRLDVASTAPTKFKKKLQAAEHDCRVRGAFVGFGAGTGRWSSRGPANFQNAARPILGDKDIKLAFEMLTGSPDVDALFQEMHVYYGDRLTDLVISCVRGAVAAPEGWEFLDADLSSIENRVAVWIAGQDDVLAKFATGKFDQYRDFASTALYNVPIEEVTSAQRQVSKSAVLGSVFGQGAKGLVEYAKKMGVVMTLDEAQRAVKAFRTAYSHVKNCWYACGNAAVRAINRPGEWTRINDKLRMIVWRGFLWLEIPSGRHLAWYAPRVEQDYAPWTERVFKGYDDIGAPVYKVEHPLIDVVTVESVDTKTRKFKRHQLIGSSIYQSAVQGTAADILAEGVIAAEEDGMPSVLLAHDQSLVLVPKGTRTVDELIAHMTAPRPWREDLPLAAEGQVVDRFAK